MLMENVEKYMLTSGKLINWLKQFPEDTLIYAMEMNTGDLQELPDIDDIDGNNLICTIKKDKEYTYKWLKSFYKEDVEKINSEFNDMYKYVKNDKGIVIRL